LAKFKIKVAKSI